MQVQVLFPAPKNERHEAFVLSVSHAAIGPCRRQSAGSVSPYFPMNRCEQQGRKKRRFPDETAGHDCQGKKRCSAEAAPAERNRSSMRPKVVLRNLLQRRGAVDAFVDELVHDETRDRQSQHLQQDAESRHTYPSEQSISSGNRVQIDLSIRRKETCMI